ncbi:hypothetical protein Tco_1094767 [Tanacetum coccineum]|uniref:Uncharacterized protein n=1 Tax=Tanacetum coccineum TaxID=301880 RepID=A0ABQ5IGG1_9ASTR
MDVMVNQSPFAYKQTQNTGNVTSYAACATGCSTAIGKYIGISSFDDCMTNGGQTEATQLASGSYGQVQLNKRKLLGIKHFRVGTAKLRVSTAKPTGLGYNAVPPLPTCLFAPTIIDLSHSGIEKFKEPKLKVSDDEEQNESKPKSEKKIVIPTFNTVKASDMLGLDMPKNRQWIDHVSKQIKTSVTLKRLDYILECTGLRGGKSANKEKEDPEEECSKSERQVDEVFGRIPLSKENEVVKVAAKIRVIQVKAVEETTAV